MGTSSRQCADGSGFSDRVRDAFGRQAASYEAGARLQEAVAWRLGHLCRELPLEAGPRADLGAGSGLLSRALLHHWSALGGVPPLQLDHCGELLARNPLLTGGGAPEGRATMALWDLNQGLPDGLESAALLASNFALHWLDAPALQLRHWCDRLRTGGWLLLAVPTSGSFRQWHHAAHEAGVPCTALELPTAGSLIDAAAEGGLQLERCVRLRFSRPPQDGLATLRQLRALGAGASRRSPLAAGEMRRLLARWPAHTSLTWEVLILVGRKE